MTHPLDNGEASYLVLLNGEGQYSMWPEFARAPEGWTVLYGQEGRQACLDYIRSQWTDMRPGSLDEVNAG